MATKRRSSASGSLAKKRTSLDNAAKAFLIAGREDDAESSVKVNAWYDEHCLSHGDVRASSPGSRFVCSKAALYKRVEELRNAMDDDDEEVEESLDANSAGSGASADANNRVAQALSRVVAERKVHNRATLTPAHEKNLAAALLEDEDTYGGLTDEAILSAAWCYGMLAHSAEEEADDDLRISNGMVRLGYLGDKWLDGFLARNDGVVQRRRALEVKRQQALQPERVVQHLRNCMWAQTLVQIGNAIGAGRKVPGWSAPPGESVQRTEDNSVDQRAGDVIVKVVGNEKVMWITALNEQLQPVKDERVFCLDEVAVDHNDMDVRQVSLKGKGAAGNIVVGLTTGTHVTMTPVWDRRGTLLACQVLADMKGINDDLLEFFRDNDFAFESVPSGYQTDGTFERFLAFVLPLMGCSRSDRGILFYDGHDSHISRAVRRLLDKHYVVADILPSHTTTILQVGDNGPNRKGKSNFRQANTMAQMFASSGMMSMSWTALEGKIRMFAQSLIDVPSDVVVSAWATVGLPSCVSRKWAAPEAMTVDKFRPGERHRDAESLPPITSASAFRALFDADNLVLPWGSAMVIPKSVELPERVRARLEHVKSLQAKASDVKPGHSQLFYVIAHSNVTPNEVAKATYQGIAEVSSWPAKDGPSATARANDSKRQVSQKVPTAYGILLDGDVSDRALIATKAKADEKAAIEARATADRDKILEEQKTVSELLLSTGFISAEEATEKIVIAKMDEFVAANAHVEWPTYKSLSRSEKIAVITNMVANKPKKGRKGWNWHAKEAEKAPNVV